MNINIDENRLTDLIRQVVSNVLDEKLSKIKIQSIQTISDLEMDEINQSIGSPEKYNNQDYETLNI